MYSKTVKGPEDVGGVCSQFSFQVTLVRNAHDLFIRSKKKKKSKVPPCWSWCLEAGSKQSSGSLRSVTYGQKQDPRANEHGRCWTVMNDMSTDSRVGDGNEVASLG